MTDLINRVNEIEKQTIGALFEKYRSVLEFAKSNEDLPYLAYIINLSVNYLQANHKEESKDWKAWSVVVIKRLFETEKLTEKEDIYKHIDKFLEHKKKEYKKYVDNIALYSDEYYRDSPFVDRYIKQL